MTSRAPEPHSRWRLREKLDRLAVSYDAAAEAIDAFARAARDYDPDQARPALAARVRTAIRRIAGSHGWPRIIWFIATLLLAGSFMAWISLAITRRFIPGPIPAALAVAPGVLVTLTLAGTAAALAGTPPRQGYRSWPFAIALAGCAAWVVTWLIGVASVTAWFAAGTAVLAAAVTGAAFLVASQLTARPPSSHPVRSRSRPPRRLLARQQAAQKRLRGHAAQWSSAAHACGRAVGVSTEAGGAMNTLLSTGSLGEIPGPDMDAFHIQVLTTLLRYEPDSLRVRLQAASERLRPEPVYSIATPDRSIQ
jgi:hypothetical protein